MAMGFTCPDDDDCCSVDFFDVRFGAELNSVSAAVMLTGSAASS
jgi:hypothetical protein